jgi:hypothetical protein
MQFFSSCALSPHEQNEKQPEDHTLSRFATFSSMTQPIGETVRYVKQNALLHTR